MTADEHNKTLATLYFIYSGIHGLTLTVLLMLVLVVKFASSAGELLTTPVVLIGSVVFLILLVVVGLLPLMVAYGFRKRSRWVRPLGSVTAVLSLINVPIGTALGIYTLKFFRSEGGHALYRGAAGSTSDDELKDAMSGAQPLMNWADRLK